MVYLCHCHKPPPIAQQVKVLDMTYQIKVNQLGFGMRGQSQNTAIINYLKDWSPAR
jgi:hypothetical protein